MRVGFVGCGHSADSYWNGLKRYPDIQMVAAADRDHERAEVFGKYYSLPTFSNVDDLLAHADLDVVVNLTNPASHFEVSKTCLEAGKHVYTEKPIAMTFAEARALVDIAESNGVYFSAAPCGLLGETAQTLWRAVRSGEIGTVRAVYAELNDGPVQLRQPHLWRSESGAPFPYRDEFEVGCTLEHAAYYLVWCAAFFGPATTVTSFAACVWPDKRVVPDEPLCVTTPDLSVACIRFESGVVLRLTCSIVAPHDHGVQIVGDKGVLTVDDLFNYSSPVHLEKYSKRRLQAARFPLTRRYPVLKAWVSPRPREYPPVRKVSWRKRHARYRQDLARGIAELARAVRDRRPSRLPADFCLHVNELVLAIETATGTTYPVTTTFEPLQPMDDDAIGQFFLKDW